MNNIIQPSFGARTFTASTKSRETRRDGTQGSSFPGRAAQASQGKSDMLEINRAESTRRKTELSEAEEMQIFKKEFYEDLSDIAIHPTVSSAAVNISDAAFQAMKDNPEYRSRVLSLLQRDLGAAYVPGDCSVLMTVGTSLDQYRGDSWSAGNDSEFHIRSQDSFYKKTGGSRDRKKELLEEYQEKKLQARRRRQRLLDKAARDRYILAQMGAQEKSFSGIADLLKTRIAAEPSIAPETSLHTGMDAPSFEL